MSSALGGAGVASRSAPQGGPGPALRVTIPHLVPSGELPYFYSYKREDAGPQSNSTYKPTEVVVSDARGREEELTLDKNGVTLVPHETALSRADFYEDPEKIKRVYYPEVEELLRQVTGASKAVCFDHGVRNREISARRKSDLKISGREMILSELDGTYGGPKELRGDAELKGGASVSPTDDAYGGLRRMRELADAAPVQAYAHTAHNDYTVTSAAARIRDLAKQAGDLQATPAVRIRPREGSASGSASLPQDPSQAVAARPLLEESNVSEYLRNRYIFINVWRNISDDPIQANPLGFVDGATVAEEHFAEHTMYYDGGRVGRDYRLMHDARHEWLYFSKMRREEALLLKCFDSDQRPGEGFVRYTAHCALIDPETPPDAPPRESIEARCVVFFDPESSATRGGTGKQEERKAKL